MCYPRSMVRPIAPIHGLIAAAALVLACGCHLLLPYDTEGAEGDARADGRAWQDGPQQDTGPRDGPPEANVPREDGQLPDLPGQPPTTGRALNSMVDNQVNDVALDSKGHVYITGTFRKATGFGGGVSLSGNAQGSLFVARYPGDLSKPDWAVSCAGISYDASSMGAALAFDNAGSVLVAGRIKRTATCAGTSVKPSGSSFDVLALALDPVKGTYKWHQTLGGSKPDHGNAVATGSGGNVYVAGTLGDKVTVGSTTYLTDGNDGFVAWIATTPKVEIKTVRVLSTPSTSDGAYDIAWHNASTPYLTVVGTHGGVLKIDGVTVPHQQANDAFMLGLTPDLKPKWGHRIGGDGYDAARSVTSDDKHGAVVVGTAVSTKLKLNSLPLGGGAGDTDPFVARINAKGIVEYAVVIGNPGHEWVHDVEVDATGQARFVTVQPASKAHVAALHTYDVTKGSPAKLPKTLGSAKLVQILGLAMRGASGGYACGWFDGSFDITSPPLTGSAKVAGFVASFSSN